MSETIRREFDTVLQDGAISSPEELAQIQDLKVKIQSLPIEQQRKLMEDPFMQVLETAIANHTGDEKIALEALRNELRSQKSIEYTSRKESFSGLKEEFGTFIGTNASMKFFHEQFDGIVERLTPDVAPEIRDTMMLPVWRGWISHMDDLGVAAGEAVKYMMSLGSEGKEIEKGSGETLIGKMFQEIEDFVVRVDSVQKQMTQTGRTDLDFTNSSIVDAIFRGEDDPEKLRLLNTSHEAYFEETRKLTEKYATSIKDMDASIGGMIKMLGGEDFGKKLGAYAKENPWFGVILSILGLGGLLEGFIDGNEKNRMQSLAQLSTLSSTDNSPISRLVPENFFKGFDYKKLDPFFKHLAAQKVDFTHENFWENLLSGKSKDSKIDGIHSLLSSGSEAVFTEDDFKDGGKGMIEKLNSLPKLEQQQKQQSLKTKKVELASTLPPVIGVTAVTKIDTGKEEEQVSQDVVDTASEVSDTKEGEKASENTTPKDIREQEIVEQSHEEDTEVESPETQTPVEEPEQVPLARTPEQIESDKKQYVAFRDVEIAENISNATEFPVIFNYTKQKEYLALGILAPKSLDFKDGQLLIGEVPYGVTFSGITHEFATIKKVKLDSAEFSTNAVDLGVTVNGEAYRMKQEKKGKFQLLKEDFGALIIELINNSLAIREIPKIEGITGGTYTISKSGDSLS